VRDTSAGRVGMRFWKLARRNVSVAVWRVDESGWPGEVALWNSAGEEGTLADAILRVVSVPPAEAQQLGTLAMAEWRERGAESEGQGDLVKGLGLIGGLGVGLVALVAAAAVVVWFVLTRL
jgi:hypothetical protein